MDIVETQYIYIIVVHNPRAGTYTATAAAAAATVTTTTVSKCVLKTNIINT